MILKYYNLDNKLLEKGNIFLLYGDNEGLKKEVIKKISKDTQILTYDEKQILNDQNEFFESTLTKSLFEPHKTTVVILFSLAFFIAFKILLDFPDVVNPIKIPLLVPTPSICLVKMSS